MRLKRILSALLCVLLICSLAACSGGKNPETKPKTSDTPELSEYEKWQERMLSLCNMDYDGFIGYWDLRCDGFYGDDLTTLRRRNAVSASRRAKCAHRKHEERLRRALRRRLAFFDKEHKLRRSAAERLRGFLG